MSKTIEVNFPGNKRVDAKIDDRIIKTDQSVKNGGDASAPEPFQLFLVSIATCAGIYALQFCHTRNLSTEGMSLKMTCTFDPDIKQYSKMDILLKLPLNFPETHRDAIIRAMDLCSVKKHMISAPEFSVQAELQD
jgi:uncharacterized OsmC-like protein